MKKAITQKGVITVGVPKFWEMKDGAHDYAFNTRADEVHFSEGWKPVIEPVSGVDYNPETQRLGAIYERENDFTYPIVDIPEEELKARFENETASKQSQLLEEEQKKIALNRFQVITDQKEALEVKEAYPAWDVNFDYLTVQKDHKVTRTLKSEKGYSLELFFLIQPHTPQDDPSYYPENAPALWSWVKIGEGGIEVWTQPTGGDGKYPYLDPNTGKPYQVTHNGKLWENNVQGMPNVWVPGEYGWTDLGPI